jgi:hypothetical protein
VGSRSPARIVSHGVSSARLCISGDRCNDHDDQQEQ